MSGTSLMALTADYQRLMQMLMQCEGELTPEIEQELAVNSELLAKKADGYDFIVTKLEAEEEYWKQRAAQYTKVARTCANARERLRDAIKFTMKLMDTTEIVGENVTYKLVNGAPKLVLDQPSLLPSKFVNEIVTREPNKDLIKGTLKDGELVPGAHLEPVVQLRTSVSRKTK